MPPISHNVRGFNAVYEMMSNVINIIQQGLEVHMLVYANEDQCLARY